jgi:hypothetical protein
MTVGGKHTVPLSSTLLSLLLVVGCAKGNFVIKDEESLRKIRSIAFDRVTVHYRDTRTEEILIGPDLEGRRSADSARERLVERSTAFLTLFTNQHVTLKQYSPQETKGLIEQPVIHDSIQWSPKWLVPVDSVPFDAFACLDLTVAIGTDDDGAIAKLSIYPKAGNACLGVVQFNSVKGREPGFGPTLAQGIPRAIEAIVKRFAMFWNDNKEPKNGDSLQAVSGKSTLPSIVPIDVDE